MSVTNHILIITCLYIVLVITGCTDGIGKAYACELAKLGYSLVLISRNLTKLQDLAAQLEKEHFIRTVVIDVDFTSDDYIYKRLEDKLSALDVGTLINNVGICSPYPDYFMELPGGEGFLQDLVSCNIIAITRMSRIVLKQMEVKNRGLILNLSSISGSMNVQLLSVYGASKAFIDRLSQVLSLEYSGTGIHIQTLVPGYIATKLSGMKRGYFTPDPTSYVRGQLKTIGKYDRTTGYWFHEFLLILGEHGMHIFTPILNYVVRKVTFPQRAVAIRKGKKTPTPSPISSRNVTPEGSPTSKAKSPHVPHANNLNGYIANAQIPNDKFANGHVPNGKISNGYIINGKIANGHRQNGKLPNDCLHYRTSQNTSRCVL